MPDKLPTLPQMYHQLDQANTAKRALYDWYGTNEWLFLKINHTSGGEIYDKIMLALSRIGDHHNFIYYFAATCLCALSIAALRILRQRGGNKAYLSLWVGVLIILLAGYGAVGGATKLVKSELAYPRPYVALDSSQVILRTAMEEEKKYQSFPSGHSSFSMFMLVALWPVLFAGARWAGVLLVLGVGWSRMALGVHFPADVLAGFLLGLIVTLLVRLIVFSILRGPFGLRF